MQNSFQIEVKLMYQEILKIIYRMPKDKIGTLLIKPVMSFKRLPESREKISLQLNLLFICFRES